MKLKKRSFLAFLLVFSMIISLGGAASFAAVVEVEADAGESKSTEVPSIVVNVEITKDYNPKPVTGADADASGVNAAAEITVDQNISVTATTSDDDLKASVLDIDATASDSGETTVTVGTDAKANGENSASILSANAYSDGDVTVSIGGDAAADGGDRGSGVFARAEGEGSSVEVEINGGMEASGDWVNAVEVFANKVQGESGSIGGSGVSSVDVSVGKDIDVTAGTYGEAVGGGAINQGETSVEVGGDIIVSAADTAKGTTATADAATASVEVDGSISVDGAKNAVALSGETSSEGEVTFKVGGDVSAESKFGHASDVFARAEGDDAETTVEISGDVEAVGVTANGISAMANEMPNNGQNNSVQTPSGESLVTVTTEGDLNVVSTEGFAQGMSAHAKNEGEVHLSVGGSAEIDAAGTATGISVSADDAFVEVDVDEDLIVESRTDTALGVKASAVNDGGVQVAITGSVDIDAKKDATGISVSADDEFSFAGIVIDEELTVNSESGNAQGVQADAVNNAEVFVVVGGETSVLSGENEDTDGRAAAFTVDANSGGKSGITAGGEVSAEAEDHADGIFARAGGDDSIATVDVLNGGLTVSAGSANGIVVGANSEPEGYSNPDAEYSGEAYVEVSVDGDVFVTATTGDAEGVSFEASAGGEAEAEVHGEVSVNAKEDATGISGEADNASVTVTITKSILAESETGVAQGIDVFTTNKGDVTVNADRVEAKGAEVASAVQGEAEKGATALITVSGSLTAEAMEGGNADEQIAVGALSEADGEGSESQIIIEGSVVAKSAGMAEGLAAFATSAGRAEIYTTGNVTVDGTYVYGIIAAPSDPEDVAAPGGKVVIEVGGNALVSGEEFAAGVFALGISEGSDISIETSGVVTESNTGETIGVAALGGEKGQITITIGGNGITASGPDKASAGIYAGTMGTDIDITVFDDVSAGTGIMLFGDLSDPDAAQIEGLNFAEKAHEGTISVTVEGDVIGEEVGLAASSMPLSEAVMDVLVDGTISGGEASIVIDQDNVTEENLKLTVWKVELNDAGNAVEADLDENATEAEIETAEEKAEEFEKSIMYIIRVEQPDHATLSLEGTEDSHGYDTANEDDKVVLKIDVNAGYHVTGAYNGDGEKVPLLKDENGDFYVIVPKGGGVYLTATIDQDEEESSSTPVYIEVTAGTVTSNSVSGVPGYRAEITGVTADALKQEILSTADQQLVRFGNNVSITVEVEDATNTVKPEVKQEIEEVTAGEEIAQWLDVSLSYQVGGRYVRVEKTSGKVPISLAVPEELLDLASSGAVFELVGMFEGKIVRIPTRFDPFTRELIYMTEYFGIFALVCTPVRA